MSRLDDALARIDAANAEDPTTVVVDGDEVPAALAYGRRMSAWLAKVAPEPSEELALAARAQHLQRWKLPRDQFATGRAGYKKWRSQAARMHADLAAEILADVGYADDVVARVRQLLTKQKLKSDPEVQALEDTACLVFLDHYFAEFADEHDDDKLVDIVRKTWKKMSPSAHELALALDLPERPRSLVARALDPR